MLHGLRCPELCDLRTRGCRARKQQQRLARMDSDQADEEKEWTEGRKQTIVAKAKDKAKAKKDKAKGQDGGSAGSTQTIAAMKAARRQKETLPPVGYRP